MGQRNDVSVVQAWMASPSHRRAILDRRTTIGSVASSSDGAGQTYRVTIVAQLC